MGQAMEQSNQVFLQLREANRYALVQNPVLRRLAVVLLDNIVELQLSRKAQNALMFDETTRYAGVRQHDRKVRRNVGRFHAELVGFAKAQGWINEQDCSLLQYAHEV